MTKILLVPPKSEIFWYDVHLLHFGYCVSNFATAKVDVLNIFAMFLLLVPYINSSRKSDNYRKRKVGKKQRRIRLITLRGAIEITLIHSCTRTGFVD